MMKEILNEWKKMMNMNSSTDSMSIPVKRSAFGSWLLSVKRIREERLSSYVQVLQFQQFRDKHVMVTCRTLFSCWSELVDKKRTEVAESDLVTVENEKNQSKDLVQRISSHDRQLRHRYLALFEIFNKIQLQTHCFRGWAFSSATEARI